MCERGRYATRWGQIKIDFVCARHELLSILISLNNEFIRVRILTETRWNALRQTMVRNTPGR